jgi:DNA-binding MarR family transcriptional regulator
MRSPSHTADSAPFPLSVLLSQLLVAYTIELDNEFEHQMPHRTTNHGGTSGPWLVSMVMWWNCMRFMDEQGVRVGKLVELARTDTHLNGMARWGYIVVAPDPSDSRPKPPLADWIVRATRKGRKAQQVWRPLFGLIESRWRERFGQSEIDRLCEALWALARQFEIDLPDCLPILGYGLFSQVQSAERPVPFGHENGERPPLPALLARVLLAFAMEFEHRSKSSLAISANVMRCLSGSAIRVRDLPGLSGVSKEAISMALGVLEKRGFAVVEADQAAGRSKTARLTDKGLEAWEEQRQLLTTIEERWMERFGAAAIRNLREALEQFQWEQLACGLEPYADGWRASVRKPGRLPHFPMVLHRGGFPDGS